MGVQLSSDFYSDNGSSYDIEIYNESFGGTTKVVLTNDLKITYESQGDDIMEALKASRCSFTLVNDSTEVDTFIANLVAGNEDQFKLVVRKQNKLEWCGVILVDQVSWEDMPKPRLLTLTAIDGIGRLADIEFDYTATAQESLLKWIYECLEYNDLSQFWGSSHAYFKESCEVYETQMTNTGTQYSPYLQTRCDRALFLTDEVIGEKDYFRGPGGKTRITLPDYRPLTCAEVLNNILTIMSCRMFISGGAYYIQQIRNFSTSSYNQRSISKSLSVLSYESISPRQTEGTEYKRLGDCRWTYLTPLQEVRLNSIPKVSVAQSGGGLTQLDDTLSPASQTIQLGTLTGGSGSGKTVRVLITIDIANKPPFFGDLDIEVNFSAGTSRLKSAATTPDIITWTTNAADRVDRTIPNADLQNNDQIFIEFEAPEFPLSSQTGCTLAIECTANNWIDSLSGLPLGVAYIHPTQIIVLTDGEIVQEAQFKVINPRTQNSKTIDYGTPLLNDITQDFSSKNTFEVNTTGSTWVFSNVWDAGYSTDVELLKTLCLETMSLQDRVVKVLQGTIKVPISLVSVVPHIPRFNEVYYYESDSYYYNGGTLDCIRDEFSGEWIQFTQNKGGLSIEQQDGDGYVYRGDIKVGLPKKKTDDKDKWTRDFALINELGTIDTDSSGAVTSISIDALGKAVFNGDKLAILHPVNLRTIGTVVVDGNQPTPATSITIDSQDIDVLAGYIVVQKMTDLIETGKGRFDQLVTSNNTAPSSGGFGDGGNAILNPGDGFLYYTDGSDTWKITGTLVT